MSAFLQRVKRLSHLNTYTLWCCRLLSTSEGSSNLHHISTLNHNRLQTLICKRHLHWINNAHKLLHLRNNLVHLKPLVSRSNSNFTLRNEVFKAYVESLEEEYDSGQGIDGKKSSEDRMEALRQVVYLLNEARGKYSEMEELMEMEKDDSLKDIVVEDKKICQEEIDELEEKMLAILLPADNKYDDRDVILEVECGAGGLESMLFAYELFTMYQKYAAYKGWNWSVISMDKGGAINEPAIRKASVSINGAGVHGWLKYEGGVHRVKRNPVTDPSRIHTSTVSVAILFQPNKIDLVIDEKKDLIVETCRASGPGGQNVQKTESNVRIKHIPTGLQAESQETRSQHLNKERALQQLTARIMDMQMQKIRSETQSQRKIQVGGKSRSERIRTYMYSKDIVIEHRLGKQMKDIENFLTGGDGLDNTIEELREEADIEGLQIRLEEFDQQQQKKKKQDAKENAS